MKDCNLQYIWGFLKFCFIIGTGYAVTTGS